MGLRVFSGQDDDVDTAAAMRNCPLNVSNPLQAYPFRISFERRPEPGLVSGAIPLANYFVVPHRHGDCSSIAADR
jgi:hypothetical protein